MADPIAASPAAAVVATRATSAGLYTICAAVSTHSAGREAAMSIAVERFCRPSAGNRASAARTIPHAMRTAAFSPSPTSANVEQYVVARRSETVG